MSAPSSTASALGATASTSPIVTQVATRARPFDLRRQESIERARLRRLQPMLETVAHRIGGSLTSALRQPVRVEVRDIEQVNWEDFAASLPEPTFLSSAVLLPLEGRVVLHLPVPLAMLIIDYYLGGDGLNQPERDQLTEIERALVGGLAEDVWKEIPQPFSTFTTLSPAMTATSTSALLMQVGRPGILCLVVQMSVAVADGETAEIQLCIPGTVVLSLIEQLERHQSDGGIGGGLDRREARRRMLSVPVELKLGYPPLGLTPAELLSLRVGDVVHIGQMELNEPQLLELTVGDVRFGTGMLVESGNKLACKVVTKKESEAQ